MSDTSDLRLYERYQHYLQHGAEEDEKRGGTLGAEIMNEVIKRAGGSEHIKSWLYKMSLRKGLKDKSEKH